MTATRAAGVPAGSTPGKTAAGRRRGVRRAAVRIGGVLLAAQTLTACGLLYIPGDRAREAQDVNNAAELRRQLAVFVDECTNSAAAGTLRNRSTSTARVVVAVRFTTPSGPVEAAAEAVVLAPDATAAWRIPAPAGTQAVRLCGSIVSSVELVEVPA